MTPLHYQREPDGEWYAHLSPATAEAIHVALTEAEIIPREDGVPHAVGVLDLPHFYGLRVAGEEWFADDGTWDTA